MSRISRVLEQDKLAAANVLTVICVGGRSVGWGTVHPSPFLLPCPLVLVLWLPLLDGCWAAGRDEPSSSTSEKRACRRGQRSAPERCTEQKSGRGHSPIRCRRRRRGGAGTGC